MGTQSDQLVNHKKQEDEYAKRESNASRCYITTACAVSRGLPDDCEELTVLRAFRDQYILRKENGSEMIKLYYRYSPSIVEAIEQQENASAIYGNLFSVIQICVDAIKRGKNELALAIYCEMVIKLKEHYLPEVSLPDTYHQFNDAAVLCTGTKLSECSAPVSPNHEMLRNG